MCNLMHEIIRSASSRGRENKTFALRGSEGKSHGSQTGATPDADALVHNYTELITEEAGHGFLSVSATERSRTTSSRPPHPNSSLLHDPVWAQSRCRVGHVT